LTALLFQSAFAFGPVDTFFHNIAWLLKKIGSTQPSLSLTNAKQPEHIINEVIPVDFDKCNNLENCQMRIKMLIEYHKIRKNLQEEIIEEQKQSIETQKQIIEVQQDTIAIQKEIGKQKLVLGVLIGTFGASCLVTIGLIYSLIL